MACGKIFRKKSHSLLLKHEIAPMTSLSPRQVEPSISILEKPNNVKVCPKGKIQTNKMTKVALSSRRTAQKIVMAIESSFDQRTYASLVYERLDLIILVSRYLQQPKQAIYRMNDAETAKLSLLLHHPQCCDFVTRARQCRCIGI